MIEKSEDFNNYNLYDCNLEDCNLIEDYSNLKIQENTQNINVSYGSKESPKESSNENNSFINKLNYEYDKDVYQFINYYKTTENIKYLFYSLSFLRFNSSKEITSIIKLDCEGLYQRLSGSFLSNLINLMDEKKKDGYKVLDMYSSSKLEQHAPALIDKIIASAPDILRNPLKYFYNYIN